MADWTGLDPGGTEQLWDPELLIECLKLFKHHEPFSRGDPESPLYPDLEDRFPEVTWRSFDKQNSFRPVFRKTNPWVKLNLITDETSDAHVTPLGDELLSGEKSLAEIFIDATKNHFEPDGTASYRVLCEFWLSVPQERLTLEDVAFAVEDLYLSGVYTPEAALTAVRSKRLTFVGASRQPRRLRAFMNCLVSAGAIQTSVSGWTLFKPSVAREIADVDRYDPHDSSEQLAREEAGSSAYRLHTQRKPQATTYSRKELGTHSRSRVSSVVPTGKSYDPINRALLLEKANSIHERLIVMCANEIRSLGFTPLEDANSFDVACAETRTIIEVKSINSANAVSQFRKAIAQLPEYRWRHRDAFDHLTRLIVVVNQDPRDYLDDDFFEFILNDRSIEIFWDCDGVLRNRETLSLKDALALSG